ncbi:MAG: molybdate ABC transporter substrate-binding protein [Planctomycetales bacterium]
MSFRPRIAVLFALLIAPAVISLGWSFLGRARDDAGELMFYCAAGMRHPVDEIVQRYEEEHGVRVRVEYGGSNDLLSRIQAAQVGDLFLAGDDSYTRLAREKGLAAETIPVATMRPVIAVPKGNPKKVRGVADLLRGDVRTALGNPDQAAVGKTARALLEDSGHWSDVESRIRRDGVFTATVNDIANAVKIGSVDAGVVWDTTVAQYPELEAIRTPELDAGTARIEISVLTSSERPTAALRFARYLTARDKGLEVFREKHFETVEGDQWVETPQLVFYIGSVNRGAVQPVIDRFQRREGVEVFTNYNGCGILTADMRLIRDQKLTGFPDTYMACDVHYLNVVREQFQEARNVSDTEIVIAVAKGNPKGIRTLADLTRPGVRVVIGEPSQCTIGVLTVNLLRAEGLEQELLKVGGNVVARKPSSAMLVPDVTTGAADAALAFATDTRAESDKLDVIRIESRAVKAIQPFAIARSSDHKELSRRLYRAISEARGDFEKAGFHFRGGDEPAAPGAAPAAPTIRSEAP